MPDQPAQEQRKDTQCSRLLHGCTGLGARRVKNSRWGIDYIRMSALGGIPGVVVGSLVCGIGRNPLPPLGLRDAHCLAHWIGPDRIARNPRGALPEWCRCIAPSPVHLSTCPLVTLSTCPLVHVCTFVHLSICPQKKPREAQPPRGSVQRIPRGYPLSASLSCSRPQPAGKRLRVFPICRLPIDPARR